MKKVKITVIYWLLVKYICSQQQTEIICYTKTKIKLKLYNIQCLIIFLDNYLEIGNPGY